MLATILLLGFAATWLGGFARKAFVFSDRVGLARLLAFRSGILVAVAFVDVLPEAWGLAPRLAGWGALAAFAFCYASEHVAVADPCHEELEDCHSHGLGWTGLVGLLVHALIDGVNVGAASFASASALLAVGAATVLHKAADGFTLTSLLRQGGFKRGSILLALGAIAFATPLGALGSYLGGSGLGPEATSLLLGFAGGSFLYIGATDIVPHLHRSRDGASFAAFAAGLSAMFAISRLAS